MTRRPIRMIGESLEKPYFQGKLRVRTYDASPQADSQVFWKSREKVRKVVDKRRIATELLTTERYLAGNANLRDSRRLRKEIEWLFRSGYGGCAAHDVFTTTATL